jgi:hypothetical protein
LWYDVFLKKNSILYFLHKNKRLSKESNSNPNCPKRNNLTKKLAKSYIIYTLPTN